MKFLLPAPLSRQALVGLLSAALLLLQSSAVVSAQPHETDLYDCTFSEELSIHRSNEIFFQHYVNYEAGTYTMRLRYTGGNAWIGIGTNYIDKPRMIPAYAVIGRNGSGRGSVQRYWLEGDAEDGSGVIPYADVNGHLKATSSFTQRDGESNLEFTHDLIIKDEETGTGAVEYEVSADSTWIWAVGLPDNQWEGAHRIHGSFQNLELFDSCVAKPAAEPEGTEVPEGTQAPEPEPPQLELEDEAELELEEEKEELEEDTDLGIPRETDTPIDQPLESPNRPSTMNSTNTVSVSAASSQSVEFNDTGSTDTRTLWIAHGIMMALAWGIIAPLAIGASLLRNKLGPSWLSMHLTLNLLVVFLTMTGFLVAVWATEKENEATNTASLHFTQDKHHTIGLAIFMLVLVQTFAGYFRPSAAAAVPASATSKTTSRNNDQEGPYHPSASEDQGSDKDGEVDAPSPQQEEVAPPLVNAHTNSKPKSMPMLRQLWEYSHRSLGVILLALAWYNCHSGIELQAQNYYQDDEQQLTAIFWGITGGIAGLVFFLAYVMRY